MDAFSRLGRLWGDVVACGLAPRDLGALAGASRAFSEAVAGEALNMAWAELAVQRWPTTKRHAKIRSWRRFVKRRALQESGFAPLTAHPIENCEADFECPLILENMVAPDVDTPWWMLSKIHCTQCRRDVELVTTREELEDAVARDMCVSFFDAGAPNRQTPEDPEAPPIRLMLDAGALGPSPRPSPHDRSQHLLRLQITLVGDSGSGRRSFMRHLFRQASSMITLAAPSGFGEGEIVFNAAFSGGTAEVRVVAVTTEAYEARVAEVRALGSLPLDEQPERVPSDHPLNKARELAGSATLFCFSSLDEDALRRSAALAADHVNVQTTMRQFGVRSRGGLAALLATHTDRRGSNVITRAYHGHTSSRQCRQAANAARCKVYEVSSPPPPVPHGWQSVHYQVLTDLGDALLPKGGRRAGCMVV